MWTVSVDIISCVGVTHATRYYRVVRALTTTESADYRESEAAALEPQ